MMKDTFDLALSLAVATICYICLCFHILCPLFCICLFRCVSKYVVNESSMLLKSNIEMNMFQCII